MLSFTDASINPSVKKISSLLGLPASRSWNCVDENSSLQLFHYNADKNPDENTGKVRGLVFDEKNEVLVARSYNYIPTFITSSVTLEEGSFRMKDSDDIEHTLPKDSFKFQLGYEGTIIRVFKHEGVVYHSSHRKLNVAKSTWGNSPSFLSIYKQLNGPRDEELFAEDKKYSPYCHVFLLVHPKLLLSSLQPIGKGYIVYLGALDMYSFKNPYPEEECDLVKREIPSMRDSFPENMEEETPFIISSPEISLEKANSMLTEGWNGQGGEFIMVCSKEEKQGEFPSLYRISSPDYERRVEVRNNDPSLYHRFVELSSRAATWKKDKFQEFYKCGGDTTMNQRYQIVLDDFISHLPLHARNECEDFANKLVQDRQELVSWMCDVMISGTSFLKEYKVVPRFYDIINNIRIRRNEKNKFQIKRQLNFVLINENGSSFYKMLRLMRTVKHNQTKK